MKEKEYTAQVDGVNIPIDITSDKSGDIIAASDSVTKKDHLTRKEILDKYGILIMPPSE